VIYRNSPLVQQVFWTVDNTPMAADISIHFLRSECELLRLANVAPSAVADLEAFFKSTAGHALVVERSASGDLLVHNDDVRETLMITGKTAEVLGSYIDCEPVSTEDRLDMTLRRAVGL